MRKDNKKPHNYFLWSHSNNSPVWMWQYFPAQCGWLAGRLGPAKKIKCRCNNVVVVMISLGDVRFVRSQCVCGHTTNDNNNSKIGRGNKITQRPLCPGCIKKYYSPECQSIFIIVWVFYHRAKKNMLPKRNFTLNDRTLRRVELCNVLLGHFFLIPLWYRWNNLTFCSWNSV